MRVGRRISASVLSGLASFIAVSMIGLLILHRTTASLGPSQFGVFVSGMTLVSTMALLTDFGVSAINGREIARHPDQASTILSFTLGLRLFLSLVVMPFTLLASVLLYGSSIEHLSAVVIALAISLPFQAIRIVSFGYFVAGIRNYYDAAFSVAQQAIYFAGVVVVTDLRGPVVSYAYAYSASHVIIGIAAYFVTRHEVPFRPRFNRLRWRNSFAQSLSFGLIQVVNVLYLRADTLIIGAIKSPRQVGLYGVAYTIVTLFMTVPNLVMTSVMPISTNASVDDLPPLVNRALHLLGATSVLVASGTALLAPAAVTLLAGPHFAGAVTAVRILAVSIVFTYLNFVLGFTAVARDRHRRILYVSVLSLIVNVLGNIFVVPKFGISGAATVTVLSELFAVAGIYIVFRTDVGVRVSFTRIMLRPLLVGLVVTAIGAKFLNLNHQRSSDLIWAPVISVAYVLGLWISGAIPPEVRSAVTDATKRLRIRGQ